MAEALGRLRSGALLLLVAGAACAPQERGAGSASCRRCHATAHATWEASLHGRSFRPYAPGFPPASVAGAGWRAEVRSAEGRVVLEDGAGRTTLPLTHLVGGKNVLHVLARGERGRLLSLPVAWDVRRREWFDATAGAVRHGGDDGPVAWNDRALTFQTSCYRCHVSQASSWYEPETDTYRLAWTEPGISCETCHGPGGHGAPPMDVEREIARCGSCHARTAPLTEAFPVGGRFFDHFDLATLEDPDFHPDGRDRGENYTFTSWSLSPCARTGELGCLHCHTSGGAFRFTEAPDRACLPCHAEVRSHHHHRAGSEGSRCIACHMPSTEFARMRRSDHSMLPPTPASTVHSGSPNACTGCHAEEGAAWADARARLWYGEGYQDPVLHRASLVQAARAGDATRLPEILAYLAAPGRDEVFAASLLRLLRSFPDPRKEPALLAALADPSPLVRASAAVALEGHPSPQAQRALLAAAGDSLRLVRVRAAAALAGSRLESPALERATAEHVAALRARPDDATAHYNLGNLHLDRGQPAAAAASYRIALRLAPGDLEAQVNLATALAGLGRMEEAEAELRAALAANPGSGAAHLNLGLLLAEGGRLREAEDALRAALAADPESAQAAYNLAVLLTSDRVEEALTWYRRAAALRPEEQKYVRALAEARGR